MAAIVKTFSVEAIVWTFSVEALPNIFSVEEIVSVEAIVRTFSVEALPNIFSVEEIVQSFFVWAIVNDFLWGHCEDSLCGRHSTNFFTEERSNNILCEGHSICFSV